MSEPGAVAPTERRWGRIILALAALLLIPLVPLLRVLVPIEQTPSALAVIIAACAVAGWRSGGRIWTALIWIALAAWLLSTPRLVMVGGATPEWSAAPHTAYDWLWRGWVVLLAGSFGLAVIAVKGNTFFPKALAGLAIAMGSAFIVATAMPNGFARVTYAMLAEFNRRNDESAAALDAVSQSERWQKLTHDSPRFEELARESENQLRSVPQYSVMLVPALLALESLLVLALGWSVYHRLARARLGRPFGKLRDFRFNDQLIWGVALGATLFLLPPFEEGKTSGINLLAFFGALYVVRGLGIIAWLTKGRLVTAALVAATIFALPVVGALALALGVGDTWVDWRSRLRPAA
jgi:hypothetical protein